MTYRFSASIRDPDPWALPRFSGVLMNTADLTHLSYRLAALNSGPPGGSEPSVIAPPGGPELPGVGLNGGSSAFGWAAAAAASPTPSKTQIVRCIAGLPSGRT